MKENCEKNSIFSFSRLKFFLDICPSYFMPLSVRKIYSLSSVFNAYHKLYHFELGNAFQFIGFLTLSLSFNFPFRVIQGSDRTVFFF